MPDTDLPRRLAQSYSALAIARADTLGFGFHRTRHYLFGHVDGGGLAGLLAFSVET